VGDCRCIPLPAGSVDVVVSFETIEHIAEQELFLSEIRRVLRPLGVLIISSPDKENYSEKTGHKNPFHAKELYHKEFEELLGGFFAQIQVLAQRVALGSFVAPAKAGGFTECGVYRGDWGKIEFRQATTDGVYSLAVCSDAPLPLLRVGLFEFGRVDKDQFVTPLMLERRLTEAARQQVGDLQSSLNEQAGRWERRLAETENLLSQRVSEATQLRAELTEVRRAVASAEEWQRHWFARAFHRWRPPGAQIDRVGPLKRLERSIRKRRKGFAANTVRFLARQANSLKKRKVEIGELGLLGTVRMWQTRRRARQIFATSERTAPPLACLPGFTPTNRYADLSAPFNPEITVIVPNYNHAPYLRQRLNSVFYQTYRNFRVILLDDCSNDNSRSILHEYAQKFAGKTELIVNPSNSGSAFAQWRKGLELAKTDLVWIAESDDFCEPNFLEALVPYFRDEAIQIAYCPTVFVGTDGRTLDFSYDAYTSALDPVKWKSDYVETSHCEVRNALGIRNTIPNVSSALLRHPGNLGLLSDPGWLNMRICGDWVFYLHHLRGGKIAFTRGSCSYYRYHDSNTSRQTYKLPRYYEEHKIVAQTLAELYSVEPALFEKQRHFLREHWDYVFKEELPPSWKFEEAYNFEGIKASASHRLPNVLVVGHDFVTGGGEVFAIRLAGALQEKGFGVTFYDFDGQEGAPEFRPLLPPNIPVIQRGPHNADVARVVQDFGIEIVHTHHGSTDDYFAGRVQSNGHACRHLVTMHGMYEAMGDSIPAGHLEKLTGAVDHWFYTADKNLDPFKHSNLYKGSKFTKSRLGMKHPTPCPIPRSTLGIPQGAFVVCVASRALPEKGWVESIEAIGCSRKETGKDIHLLLIGRGQVHLRLIEQGTPPYVHLLGFKSNPVDYYAMSDLGLLATRYRSESCPLTIVECLMAGRPAVACDVGEIRSMLTTPDGGIAGALVGLEKGLVPVLQLASAINKFATHESAYLEAKALAQVAANQFDIESIVKQYEEIYAEILDSHSCSQNGGSSP
jgi:glycosyltransferase involved in cell wall biosynthesis/SAM-dependent methyltransferase